MQYNNYEAILDLLIINKITTQDVLDFSHKTNRASHKPCAEYLLFFGSMDTNTCGLFTRQMTMIHKLQDKNTLAKKQARKTYTAVGLCISTSVNH